MNYRPEFTETDTAFNPSFNQSFNPKKTERQFDSPVVFLKLYFSERERERQREREKNYFNYFDQFFCFFFLVTKN